LTYRTYRIYLGRIADEQRRVAEWEQLHRDSTEVLARAIQAKDSHGSSHVERVQYYASSVARGLGLSDVEAQAVEIAALLHDIGKLAVPEHILSKPGPLTPHERRKMQIHAQVGAEIVGAVPFPCPVAPIIRSHHERWDGTGYPIGLAGTNIPLGARILAVVDCYDAVTSERPYRRAVTPEAAIRILQEDAGKAFDPAIVKSFTELLPRLTPPAGEPGRMLDLVEGAEVRFPAATSRALGVDAFEEIALAKKRWRRSGWRILPERRSRWLPAPVWPSFLTTAKRTTGCWRERTGECIATRRGGRALRDPPLPTYRSVRLRTGRRATQSGPERFQP
jgi:putative nucleotidyltransferase with HDIG domain